MSDMLITEVNDALRQDKLHQLWQRNKSTIFMALIAIVVGTAGGQIYRQMKQTRDAEFTHTLITAQQQLQMGKAEAAVAGLVKTVDVVKGEQRALAQLWLARAQLASKDAKAAEATLADVISTADATSIWRDAACVWQTGIQGSLPKACDATADTPFRITKLELAAADAIETGEAETARPLIEALLASKTASGEQRMRAKQLQLLLPPKK